MKIIDFHFFCSYRSSVFFLFASCTPSRACRLPSRRSSFRLFSPVSTRRSHEKSPAHGGRFFMAHKLCKIKREKQLRRHRKLNRQTKGRNTREVFPWHVSVLCIRHKTRHSFGQRESAYEKIFRAQIRYRRKRLLRSQTAVPSIA